MAVSDRRQKQGKLLRAKLKVPQLPLLRFITPEPFYQCNKKKSDIQP